MQWNLSSNDKSLISRTLLQISKSPRDPQKRVLIAEDNLESWTVDRRRPQKENIHFEISTNIPTVNQTFCLAINEHKQLYS